MAQDASLGVFFAAATYGYSDVMIARAEMGWPHAGVPTQMV